MSGNIDQAVKGEEDCGDEGGESITLIGSFAQRKNFSENQNESDDDENNGDPAELGPKPEPIAFGMDRAPVAIRCGAENSEDVFEIAKADPNPGGFADELKDVGKNPPTKIARDAGAAEIAK